MKKTYITSLTLTALALVLAAPGVASAKAVTHTATVAAKTTVVAPKTIDKTTTGAIDTTANGQGTYTTTVTGTAKDKLVVTTDKFANGNTYTYDTTYITRANGNIVVNQIADAPNGKVTATDDVYVKTATAGDYTVKGVEIQANGQVDKISGTKDTTSYGTATDLTLSSGGKKETVDTESLTASDARASVTTGTNFNGGTISGASLSTTNTAPTTNAVTTTVDGAGTYAYSKASNNGQTTVVDNRTFGNGATQNFSSDASTSGNQTTHNVSSSYVSSTGASSSSSASETYTNNGNGTASIAGTFSQSNGHDGTVTGTDTKTSYGSNTQLTYTDQNGAQKTAGTEQLVVGDAVLNVNTGTTFTGQSTSSAGLITGQASGI